ncbi:MAG: phosphomannomutase [Gammaproteobacteria bacterium]|nr:phosphomannomutase [Gammaproteobacteria bacterium]
MINNQTIEQLMNTSCVGFGTSGARGLAEKMTDEICYAYTIGFIQYLRTIKDMPVLKSIAIAGDLRPSTARIMNACAKAIQDSGLKIINTGTLPSPAIALYGIENTIPTIMVTGSHIPDDRNGIKFNTAYGEILKADEEGIRSQKIQLTQEIFNSSGKFIEAENYLPTVNLQAEQLYIARYLKFFPDNALSQLKIGVYQHSGVARDLISNVLIQLGAEVINLGRSEIFIPVDTEAVRTEDERLAKEWVEKYQLDAIVSTDGDADRPLISDENGIWFRGDIVGILCAHYLNVQHIITPVSSNTLVEKAKIFQQVYRTRIGSPYVIEMMQYALSQGQKHVAGYEANGGFLSADRLEANGQQLSPLPTRDALIVLLSLLHFSKVKQCKMSKLMDGLPGRYTYSGRIKEIPSDKSMALLNSYINAERQMEDNMKIKFIQDFSSALDAQASIVDINVVDGLRITLNNDDIIHLRPSGNAPEFRCYTEAGSFEQAYQLNNKILEIIPALIS